MSSARTIRIIAATAGINYLPQMAALKLGFFSAEHLQISTRVIGPGAVHAANAVLSGECDLALGGIWRAAMYASALQKRLVAVARIVKESPIFLLSRPGLGAL